ncbi:hypothetical protein Tco_1064370 [Tanacetum coccineum]
MEDDFIPEEQVQVSDDENFGNANLLKADSRQDWWKPLPEEERPATPKPTWTIPPSNKSDVENNSATALATTYDPPAENSLLAKTGDLTTFIKWSNCGFMMSILMIADLQEHTITEKDFKNLYPSDFEDLNILILQGHLDHLFGSDKRMLSTAVKLWTQNLVICQWVKDFQLGIESYQTQLNLTKLGWDAIGYEFKHDYTIIESP